MCFCYYYIQDYKKKNFKQFFSNNFVELEIITKKVLCRMRLLNRKTKVVTIYTKY